MAAKKQKRIRFSVPQEVETRPAKTVSEPGRVCMRPGDGTLVPLVAIDTTGRPDLEALFAPHKPDTIDVAIQWGRRDGAPKGTVTLFIRFIAPVELLLILDFDVVRQGLVVDGILRTRELYLQGVGPAETDPQIRSSRVRVVVPDTKFDPIWEEIANRRARSAIEGTRGYRASCSAHRAGINSSVASRPTLALE